MLLNFQSPLYISLLLLILVGCYEYNLHGHVRSLATESVSSLSSNFLWMLYVVNGCTAGGLMAKIAITDMYETIHPGISSSIATKYEGIGDETTTSSTKLNPNPYNYVGCTRHGPQFTRDAKFHMSPYSRENNLLVGSDTAFEYIPRVSLGADADAVAHNKFGRYCQHLAIIYLNIPNYSNHARWSDEGAARPLP